MAYPLITEYNLTSGLQTVFVYANDITSGIFIDILLFVIWATVTFGMYLAQRRTGGDSADFSGCMAVGGFVTAICAVLLGLISGLVNNVTYTIVICVALISVIYYFFNRD